MRISVDILYIAVLQTRIHIRVLFSVRIIMGLPRRYRKYLVDAKEKIPKSTLRVQRLRAKRLEESRTAQVDSPHSVPVRTLKYDRKHKARCVS